MNVNVEERNPALESLFHDNKQVVFLDANIFISPDRSKLGAKPIAFQKYREYCLDPIFDSFPNLAIHESVYKELVEETTRSFADEMIGRIPTRLALHKDTELTEQERNLLLMQIRKLAVFSEYIPERDNSKDRGEIRSLSYMAVKNYLYFAANDNLPIQLIRNAEKLETGLDNMKVIQTYEMLYYLYRAEKYDNKGIRMIYKYLYYLTSREKKQNPDWGTFISEMDKLYSRV